MSIRIAVMDDMEDIAAISRSTWDGDDYLEKKARRWIGDCSLYAGEFNGKVIGTFRLSPMPAGVLWMEGLRVHLEYRSRGYGRQLADAAFATGKRIIGSGKSRCMEFSTYINNDESIHITMSQGFRVVNRFILMTREDIDPSAEIERFKPVQRDFTGLSQHIPCGWKYPRLCPEGIEWALKRCDVFRTGDVIFLRKKGSDEATPIRGAEENPDSFLDGAEASARKAGHSRSCIVLHESGKKIIKKAFDRGYDTWEPVGNYNILIFRYNM
ncbi:MAG: GNAT family N-acetyltransferase [Candidatus Aegiribacteria sp.]|nr:GNAT family N-acetyltransferase [Candidatus Aegiribacteria sp.]